MKRPSGNRPAARAVLRARQLARVGLLLVTLTTVARAQTADSLSAPAHRSGGRALLVGVGATFAPAVLSLALNPPGSDRDFAWEASLACGVALGVIVGPAAGLHAAGRDDLARRGLIVRTLGAAAVGGGLLAALTAMSEERSNAGTAPLVVLGCAGLLLETVSFVHDLAITPSAARSKRVAAWQPGLDPQGRPCLVLKF
jgi:hypothetical protein